jgi:CDP-diacylglycerol---glycerol-3-phosphate 3-phosphatidyltransferase
MNSRICTVPTILTLFRLGFALTVSPFLLFTYLPLGDYYINKFLALMMLVLVLTDYLDGYLARTYNLVTSFGGIIDPLADKCLVLSTLVVFILLKKIAAVWVIIIFTRELVVTLLRYIAQNNNKILIVSGWGKWKATFQYCYLVCVIGMPWFVGYDVYIENIFLGLMVGATVISAMLYGRTFFKVMNKGTV